MRRRIPSLRTFFAGFVLLGAVAFATDTVALVQQAATLPPRPTPTATAVPEPTSRPRPSPAAAPAAAPVLAEVRPELAEPQGKGVHPKTGRYIAAWLPDSFDSVNRASFERNADILDEVSPFWYTTDSFGRLYHGSDARDQTLIELAHSKNVLVIPTIHNVVLSGDPVPPLISSPERRRNHIRNIVDEVVTHNYDGIDIDYEALDSSMREEFSTFIVELGEALHAQDKLLTIAVHAKTSDYGGLGGFQDWVVLGKVVDRLRIMTYDYSWRGSSPGPIAPIYWVSDVMAYAKQVVDPAKVVVGVPFYGYNWPGGGGGRAVAQTWDGINALIQNYRLSVNLQESNARGPVHENWITYNGRQAWFATSRSLDAKLLLVQDLDLAGIAIWRLGGEDPENWTVIRKRLVEDPFESQRMVNRVLPEH